MIKNVLVCAMIYQLFVRANIKILSKPVNLLPGKPVPIETIAFENTPDMIEKTGPSIYEIRVDCNREAMSQLQFSPLDGFCNGTTFRGSENDLMSGLKEIEVSAKDFKGSNVTECEVNLRLSKFNSKDEFSITVLKFIKTDSFEIALFNDSIWIPESRTEVFEKIGLLDERFKNYKGLYQFDIIFTSENLPPDLSIAVQGDTLLLEGIVVSPEESKQVMFHLMDYETKFESKTIKLNFGKQASGQRVTLFYYQYPILILTCIIIISLFLIHFAGEIRSRVSKFLFSIIATFKGIRKHFKPFSFELKYSKLSFGKPRTKEESLENSKLCKIEIAT